MASTSPQVFTLPSHSSESYHLSLDKVSFMSNHFFAFLQTLPSSCSRCITGSTSAVSWLISLLPTLTPFPVVLHIASRGNFLELRLYQRFPDLLSSSLLVSPTFFLIPKEIPNSLTWLGSNGIYILTTNYPFKNNNTYKLKEKLMLLYYS